MSEILIISDIHVNNYSSDIARLNNCIAALHRAYRLADEREISTILMCGDLFDSGEKINALVLNSVIEFFEWAAIEFPSVTMFGISGNHDQYGMNTLDSKAESALKILHKESTRFSLIDDIGPITVDGVTILGLPYYTHSKDFLEVLSASDKSDILICHQSYPGWTLGADFTSSDVEKYGVVFCGHIHEYARVGNIYSVNSPLPRTASDIDAKGVLIYNTEDKTITRHIFDFPKIEHSRPVVPTTTIQISEMQEPVVIASLSPKIILEKFAATAPQGAKEIIKTFDI